MASFALEYRFAGYSGTLEGVDVQWTERGYALIGRNVDSLRKATIDAVLPFNVAAVGARVGLSGGRGHLTCNGRTLIAGALTIRHGIPTEQGTPCELSLADDDRDETGLWPPVGPSIITRLDDDVVDGHWVFPRDAYGNVRVEWEPILREDSPYFDDIPEPSKGQTMPYVFGNPGTATTTGSPAWLVDETSSGNEKLIIAGNAVSAATVTMWGPATAGSTTLASETSIAVQSGTTRDGQVYSYVDWGDVTGDAIAADTEGRFYTSWVDGEAASGGAGDVLIAALAASSLRVDVAAWRIAVPQLNRYRLAGYCDEPVPAIEWIRSAILPLLPLAVVGGPRGLRPLLAPWLHYDDASGIPLVGGQGISVAGYVEERGTGGASRVALSYALKPTDGRFARATVARSGLTRDVGAESLSTAYVWDRATAQLMASDLLRQRTRRPRIVRYVVHDRDLYGIGGDFELYAGRTVRLTEALFGWSAVHAVVSEIEIDPDNMTVVLELRDDAVRGDFAA